LYKKKHRYLSKKETKLKPENKMNCFYHPETPSVATCIDCGKGLCISCTSNHTKPICKQCNSSRRSNEIKSIRKDFIQVFLGGILITYVYHSIYLHYILKSKTELTSEPKVLGLYLLVLVVNYYYSIGTIIGWKTLNRLTPRIFLFLPLIGWLIYFAIKLYASMFVGLVWTPVWLYKKIKRLKKVKQSVLPDMIIKIG